MPLPDLYRPGQTADDLGLPALPGHDASPPQDGRNAYEALISAEHDDPDVDAELYLRGEAWALEQLRRADGPRARQGAPDPQFVRQVVDAVVRELPKYR